MNLPLRIALEDQPAPAELIQRIFNALASLGKLVKVGRVRLVQSPAADWHTRGHR